MKTFIEFFLSLASLPFLIPWYLSEKLFEYLVQPLVFRKYRLEIGKSKKIVSQLAIWALPALVLFYLAKTGYAFYLQHGALLSAARHGLDLLIVIYNDAARALTALLTPLNTVLVFKQGGEVGWPWLLISVYLLFLPVLFVCNVGLRWVSTNRSLRQAVKLRDQAVRDVNIVRFAEKAKDDEIFFGIDINRNGAPFYAKTKWLQGHIQVIGSPGSGKTESIIQPLWFQAVRRNVPTIVVDGKASRQNIDKFFTIASSLAQGHEIIYFNPAEPERSATYNPLRRGTMTEIKNRILASLSAAPISTNTRERLDYYLNLILRAIKETGAVLTLHELAQYFLDKTHVHNQLRKINDKYAYDGVSELQKNYQAFQAETAYFIELLREIEQSDYAWLLDTNEPELDILNVYNGRRDCYFTLPIGPDDTAMRFLGQLILGDITATFHQLSLQRESNSAGAKIGEGLLVIDEVVKFVNPQFVELLRVSRNTGVSVCYTNQSLAEMENSELHLTKAFVDQLADHTNVMFCFHLGSPESIAAIINRIGPDSKIEEQSKPEGKNGKKDKNEEAKTPSKEIVIDPKFLKHLEVGRCVAFVRQPRVLGILKTGYFKFDKHLPYARREAEAKSSRS
ncbi:type IV secretory system conjugative DNA transfer family protein [candidate division KSB1 bacterium]|nr:type IV secretory system conjugative DNA transfer family protein [candidate division KSB1 bacterium]